jgi:uncharacterized coiled-coil DUF342 family protein
MILRDKVLFSDIDECREEISNIESDLEELEKGIEEMKYLTTRYFFGSN